MPPFRALLGALLLALAGCTVESSAPAPQAVAAQSGPATAADSASATAKKPIANLDAASPTPGPPSQPPPVLPAPTKQTRTTDAATASTSAALETNPVAGTPPAAGNPPAADPATTSTVPIATVTATPAPSPDLHADPKTLVTAFSGFVNKGLGGDAGALLYFKPGSPQIWIDRELGTVNKIAAEGGSGRYHMSLVEVKTQGIAAVAVLNEDRKNGAATTDYDPLFLIQIDNQWWIVPHLSNPKYARPLVTAEQFKDFTDLETCFDARKMELLKK